MPWRRIGEVQIQLRSFLILAVEEANGKRHAQAACPQEKNLCILSVLGRVGVRASLDVLDKRQTSWPCHDSNPWPANP
jgi:hypothetical protein